MNRAGFVKALGLGMAALVWVAGAMAGGGAAAPAGGDAAPALQGMVVIPAGSFTPLYAEGNRPAGTAPGAIAVLSFRLDALPVTEGQFAAFVRATPRWKRSQVKRIFAEPDYLGHWMDDETPGDADALDRPVTRVSWFAAKAYCAAQGKSLPTTEQWEYAAAASATAADGTRDPAFLQMILDWYGRPNPTRMPAVGRGFRNLWGVYDLHGLVWEWTLDFNTSLVTGESRADASLERSVFCGSGALGASNFKDYAAFMRYGFRGSLGASYTVANLGFRCAAPLP